MPAYYIKKMLPFTPFLFEEGGMFLGILKGYIPTPEEREKAKKLCTLVGEIHKIDEGIFAVLEFNPVMLDRYIRYYQIDPKHKFANAILFDK